MKNFDKLKETIDAWGRVHNRMIEDLVAAMGRERAMDILREGMDRLGHQDAEGQSARNAVEIAEALIDFEKLFGIKGEIIKREPEDFIRRVSYCPWSYFSPEACEVLAIWVRGKCKGLNPGYEYNLIRAIPRGDKICEWRVYKK